MKPILRYTSALKEKKKSVMKMVDFSQAGSNALKQ
jgi:hypothetical protein